MILPAPAPIDRLRAVMADRCGLQFDDSRTGVLDDVLLQRSGAHSLGIERYLAWLESGGDRDGETRELARLLTVGETHFFRNREHFQALQEVVLPQRMAALASRGRLRILSAGCASGEEAYSIAIATRERIPPDRLDSVEITGVDVNPAALEKAATGRYSSWSLRGTGDQTRGRWFRQVDRDFALDDGIRRMVTFEERNLLADDAAFFAPGRFDVVFCRNVVMYLTPDGAKKVVEQITRSLVPGGFVFLGHAETLRGLSRGFHLRHTHETFYYQLRSSTSGLGGAPADGSEEGTPALASEFEAATSWVDTIRRASDRIRSLTRPTEVPEGVTGSTHAGGGDLSLAVELLRAERYADALALVDALPLDSSRTADTLTLRAVLLAHRGELAAAERVCEDLLAIDELNAAAHYVMALCREGAGDRGSAIDHDQVASYLDPTFAVSRMHLGLLARKSGDHGAARRELAQAILLLEREDPLRLILFGGGFRREALIALCHAELLFCGAAS